MTIWLLALVLLASLAAVGYNQGAIRVGFSLVGILVAAPLSVPLGKLVRPALAALGVANPILQWVLGPFVVFVLILIAFKVAGLAAHQKVDVYYKYKAGDLRAALFKRLNARLGLCLGLVNALVYLVLLAWVIYAFSYWTVQMAKSDDDPRGMRILNRMGRDLQGTGMARVARALDKMPESYYAAADLAGVLYQNPLLEGRLSRYPGFISLGLKPEFQDLGQDADFSNLRLTQAPLREVLNHPKAEVIVKNPDMLRLIWKTVMADLADLEVFLETGKSAKYDAEVILGRWLYDVSASVSAYRRLKPNLPYPEVQKMRRLLAERFAKTSLIAGPDHQVVIRNLPVTRVQPNQPPTVEMQTLDGKWKGADGNYEFELAGGTDQRTAKIEASRLVMSGDAMPIIFAKED